MKDKNKRATVGPLPGVTQDIAGYKVMLLSQCFFNIKDSFIFMFLFFPYYFARQQKTWRSSMLTILPPNCCYLCGTLSLWTSFFLSLDVNSKCCKREDWGTHTHGGWLIKNDVHSLAKIAWALHFYYCMKHLIHGICIFLIGLEVSLEGRLEYLGELDCLSFFLVSSSISSPLYR